MPYLATSQTECTPPTNGINIMINNITIGNLKINLRNNDTNVNHSVFNIDSISLLVGKNGSGKTYTLQQIANSFSSQRIQAETNCQFELTNLRYSVENKLPKEFGAIYYTPVPNKPTLRRSPRLIDASPSLNKPISPAALQKHQDIIRHFGIAPQLVAKFSATPSKTINHIAERLSNVNVNKINLPSHITEAIISLRQQQSELAELDKKQELMLDWDDDPNDEKYGEVKHAVQQCQKKLYERLFDFLCKEIAPDRLFSAFTAIEKNLLKKRAGPSVTTSIFERLLNIQLLPRNPSISHHWMETTSYDFDFIANQIQRADRIQTSSSAWSAEIPVSFGEHEHFSSIASIEWSGLSSGQWALATQIAALENGISLLSSKGYPKILILIDEGDTFLHLDWQRQYLGLVDDFLGQLKGKYPIESIQAIVATHSPLLATDIPREFFINLDSPHALSQSFAAPLQTMLNDSFSSGTIGEIAIRTISTCINRLKNGTCGAFEDYIISIVDDPVLKQHLLSLKSKIMECQ